MNFDHKAALGFADGVRGRFDRDDHPTARDIDQAFWFACHGGQLEVARYLLERGADPAWLPPWETLNSAGAALRNGFDEVTCWIGGLDPKWTGSGRGWESSQHEQLAILHRQATTAVERDPHRASDYNRRPRDGRRASAGQVRATHEAHEAAQLELMDALKLLRDALNGRELGIKVEIET